MREDTIPRQGQRLLTRVRRAPWGAGLWNLKTFYLCYFVAVGIYSPYLALYFRAIHLSGAQIGLVSSLVPLAGVILPPLWGTLSDRYHWRKRLINLALFAAAVIAPIVVLAHTFALLLVLVILLAVALSPAIPLSDASTMETVRLRGGSYGGIRVFGSLGYLISSLLVGVLYAHSGIFILFPLYGALMFVTFLVSLAMPRQRDTVQVTRGVGVGEILRNRTVLVFLLLALAGYGTAAAYNTFFALYLRSLGAGTGVVGIAAAIASLSELPIMALSGRIMARLGVKPLLLASLGVAALRWTAYGLIHDYHIALVFGLLHGLTFAGFYTAGVTFIDRRIPEHLRSTGQAVFNGATFGLGTMLGANLFGVLYDHIHANGIFLVAGAICALATTGMVVFMPNQAAPIARKG